MKYLSTLFALLVFAVVVGSAGCDATPPSAVELDTAPLYSLKKGAAVRPDRRDIPPIDSTGFMTADKDTSGYE